MRREVTIDTLHAESTRGWAQPQAELSAAIDPCKLTDVIGANTTSAELYQHVEGRCTEPPVLPATLSYVPDRPSVMRDRRTWYGVAGPACSQETSCTVES